MLVKVDRYVRGASELLVHLCSLVIYCAQDLKKTFG